LSHIWR
jgi:hypothetical protein